MGYPSPASAHARLRCWLQAVGRDVNAGGVVGLIRRLLLRLSECIPTRIHPARSHIKKSSGLTESSDSGMQMALTTLVRAIVLGI